MPLSRGEYSALPLSAESPSRPTPLWAALTLTFLGSIGTGVVTNGIFFLTKQGFGFTRTQNFLLGLLLGVTYIAGSLGAGPGIARLRRIFPRISARAILAVVLVLLGALSTLPALAQRLAPELSVASVWILVAIYSPLTGVLWPTVEAFVAGGRRGPTLRSAMGIWNVVWSGAIIIAYWGMAPVIQDHAAETLLALGVLHAATALVLTVFPPEPGEHGAEDQEPHPRVYTLLLVTFRMLLPMAYVVSSTLSPYLPSAMTDLGVPERWQTVLGTAWLIPRTLAFFALERWHGWHGRWSTAVVGGVLLLSGFALTVLAPALLPGSTPPTEPHPLGITLLLTGLAVFGVGMAAIYSAAIYYAMEVGNAQVHAGGTHEALIGVGYTIGPLLGFAASAAADRGVISDRAFNGAVLGAVGVVALLVTLAVLQRVVRHAPRGGGNHPERGRNSNQTGRATVKP